MLTVSPIPQLPNDGIMGVFRRFSADPLNFFRETDAYDSPFVKLRLAHKTFYYVRDYGTLMPLLKNWRVFQKGAGELARKLLGEGLVFAEGENWTQQRRILAPAFHQKALLSYQAIMQSQVHQRIDAWAHEQAAQGKATLTQGFHQIAIHVLRDSLFGTHSEEAELQAVLDGVDVLLQHMIDRERNPLLPPLWVPTARNRKSLRDYRPK